MSPTSFETLLYAVEDGVATITLNRPEKMNAFDVRMRDELVAAFDATDADDAVRAVIVTGAGKAFCAGADLSSGGRTFDYAERRDAARESVRVGDVYRDGGGLVTLRIFRSLKPVIGAVNGAAVGVGVTMQPPMDIRIASTQARFGFVFARRGITPEAASSWFLPRLVGIQTALEWCFTGRVFDAQEAHRMGLVSRVVPAAELASEVGKYARLLATLRSGHSTDAAAAWLGRELEQAVRAKATIVVVVRLPGGDERTFTLEASGLGGGRLRGRDKGADVERTLPVTSIVSVRVPG